METKRLVDIVNNFSAKKNIMVSFCEGCEVWTVHCIKCNKKYCSGGCECGCDVFLDKQQESLDNLLTEELK